MQRDRILKLIFLFILTYVLLYFAGSMTDLHYWGFSLDFSKFDYMFYLVPVVGFFSMYLLIEWADNYYQTKLSQNILFPVLFFVISIVAYYVVLYWYFQNFAQLQGRSEVTFDFVYLLLDSAYIYFVLAALAGWASRFILDRFEK